MIIHKTINKCGAENNIATKLMFSQGNSKDFFKYRINSKNVA